MKVTYGITRESGFALDMPSTSGRTVYDFKLVGGQCACDIDDAVTLAALRSNPNFAIAAEETAVEDDGAVEDIDEMSKSKLRDFVLKKFGVALQATAIAEMRIEAKNLLAQ